MSYRAVVFDFDGVILESLDIKTRAFVELYGDHPEHREAIVRHHLENAGVSRFAKFRWIHRELLGAALGDEECRALGDRFAEIVRREILTCPFVPGAEELLRRLHGRHLLFLASGTPQHELVDIVEQRALAHWFTSVNGTPRAKGEIVGDVIAEHGLAANEVVVVGDALADLEGAREAGVAFVARVPPGEASVFPPGAAIAVVADLAELDRRWDEIGRGGGGRS